jgi:hypothetical protein
MPHKKTDTEYFLKIAPYTDGRTGKQGHAFELTTAKEFRTFRYDILVDMKVVNDEIHLVIQGIGTPHLSIPDYGPARFTGVLYHLHGTYTLTVSKLNGPKSTFTVHLTPKRTVQKGKRKKSFIQLETTHKE